jgi:hypothetical protein
MARIILQEPPKAQLQQSGILEDALPIFRAQPLYATSRNPDRFAISTLPEEN